MLFEELKNYTFFPFQLNAVLLCIRHKRKHNQFNHTTHTIKYNNYQIINKLAHKEKT